MINNLFSFLKNYWRQVLIGLFAVVFFFALPAFHAKYLEKDGRPSRSGVSLPLPADPNDVRYGIESFVVNDSRGYIYNLSGFAFTTNTGGAPTDRFQTELVVFSETQTFVLPTRDHARDDIAETFSNMDLDIRNPGFSTLINPNLIPEGEYCIGLLLTDTEGSEQIFIDAYTAHLTLINDSAGLSLGEVNQTMCEEYFQSHVNLSSN